MIKIDATQITVVALCTACGWRALRATRILAWNAGDSHQRLTHGAPGNAGASARKALERDRLTKLP
ncbi:hypothetical protein [Glutamicibacter protophormiae]